MDTLYGTPLGSFGPRWSPGRSRGFPDQNMRVSDAERGKVADELSRHYADGRLDEAEFNERLGKAVAAKTRRDLVGLLSDLPEQAPAAVREKPRRLTRPVGLVLVAVFVLSLWAVSWHWHVGFFILVVGLMWGWRRHHRHLHCWHGGHDHHHLGSR